MSVSTIARRILIALVAILIAAGLAVSNAHSANAATSSAAGYTGTTQFYASNVNAAQALAKANTLVLMHGDHKCPAPDGNRDGLIVNRTNHECVGISRMGAPRTTGYTRFIVFTIKAHGQW